MIECTLHLRGHQAIATKLPSVPAIGSYIARDGQLWRIIDIVFGKAVNLYCVGVGSITASDLEAEWASWCDHIERTECRS
jgi:hypothetical protein